MSDKPPGALIAAVIAAPLMVVCCLLFLIGPAAAIAWVTAWASGWVAGLGAVASTGLAIVAAILVYGFVRRRRAKPPTGHVSAVEPE